MERASSEKSRLTRSEGHWDASGALGWPGFMPVLIKGKMGSGMRYPLPATCLAFGAATDSRARSC
jgi:hypothetical protein